MVVKPVFESKEGIGPTMTVGTGRILQGDRSNVAASAESFRASAANYDDIG